MAIGIHVSSLARPGSLFRLMLVAALVGCGAPDGEEEGESAAGAFQAGAAGRSGLVQGSYDGEDSFSLEIVDHDGRQMASLYDDDGTVITGALVDVSLRGFVTVGDSVDGTRCNLDLSVQPTYVYAKGTCAGRPVDELLWKRSVSTVFRKFLCTEKQTRVAAELTVWRPEDRDDVVTIRWEGVGRGSTTLTSGDFDDGRWTIKPVAFNAGRWGFHLQRPNRLVWHSNSRLVNGVPTDAAGGVCRRAS